MRRDADAAVGASAGTLRYALGAMDWIEIDASGTLEADTCAQQGQRYNKRAMIARGGRLAPLFPG